MFNDIGNWLKENGKGSLALVGSIVTGNIPGAIAAGSSLIASATGTDDPVKALKTLQTDPATMIRLQELANQEEASIRKHYEEMLRLELEDKQKAHETTQATIRNGDNASDEYVRHTRPKMARQSWYATLGYIIVMELLSAFDKGMGADIEVAMVLGTPALGYIGMRTMDKRFDISGKLKNLIGK